MKGIIKQEELKIDISKWNGLSIQAERIAEAVAVDSDEEEKMAIDSVADIKRFAKDVETARKNEVEPFNKLVKRINNTFKPISDSLENSETKIKEKIKSWRIKKEAILAEEERKRLVEYQKAIAEEQEQAKKEGRDAKIIIPPSTLITTQTRGENSSASTVKKWTFEIIDANKIPREFLTPDEKKIKQAIAYGIRNIEGIKIYEDIVISVRT